MNSLTKYSNTPSNQDISDFMQLSTLNQWCVFNTEITARDQESYEKFQGIVSNAMDRITGDRQKIDKVLSKYETTTSEMNDKFNTFCLQVADKMFSSEMSLSEMGMLQGKVDFLGGMADQVQKRAIETSTHFFKILKDGADLLDNENLGLIELIFQERVKDLERLAEKVQISITCHREDFDIMLIMHNQKLKQEAQAFNQLIKKLEIEDNRAQQKFNDNFRQQELQQKADLKYEKMAIEKMKIQGDIEVERIRNNNLTEIQMRKIAFEEECLKNELLINQNLQEIKMKEMAFQQEHAQNFMKNEEVRNQNLQEIKMKEMAFQQEHAQNCLKNEMMKNHNQKEFELEKLNAEERVKMAEIAIRPGAARRLKKAGIIKK